MFKKIEVWLWKNNLHPLSFQGMKYHPIGGGDPVSIGIAVGTVVAGGVTASAGAKEKRGAENRATDFANQQAFEAKEEQKRLEEKFGLTEGELEREETAFRLEGERIGEAERRAGLTGEELLRETGPETRALLDQIAGRVGMTGEELFRAEGEIPSALADQILAGVKDPTKGFEDTLEQNLEIVRQQVNQEAQRRGVFGGLPEGGIRFEQLGRAGVELAIGKARESEAARQQALSNASALSSTILNLSATARGEAGTVGERSIQAQEQARAELDALLANAQSLSAGARGRAADVGISARSQIEPALGRQADITTDILGLQRGEGAARERAGLELIGESIPGGNISLTGTAQEKSSTSGIEDLLAEFSKKGSKQTLGEFTGRR